MNNKENLYFLTLVEAGSVTKAASMLNISQSSLSKFLIRIEKRLGVALFVRHSSPLLLSPAGRIYHEYVGEMLNRKTLLEQRLNSIKGAPQGDVTVGLTLWRSEALIPDVLPSFLAKYPLINVRVCEGNHKYIYALLEKREIDFGIINLQMQYEHFVFEPLRRERILLAVHKENRAMISSELLVQKGRDKIVHADFSLFQHEPLIHLKSGQHLYFLAKNFLAANGFTNSVRFETENISTAYRLVEKNAGITFVPEGLLKTINRSKEVAFFSIGTPPLSWELGITYPHLPALSHPAGLFIEHLKSTLPEQQ